MLPIRQTVRLSDGTVVLHAWGADVADALLTDLLTLTLTLGALRDEWQAFTRGDIEDRVWAAFWRLVQASLKGAPLPRPLTWADRLALLDAMWHLNDEEASQGKLTALVSRAQRLLHRASQGHLTTPSTSTSSGSSALPSTLR
ncbi:hypothetical protein [Deinococcus apachensis]|uniref:hypothetical protein n=1 Tax=Deinococcus apachensis TaxID=309886 RepID=UPI00036237CD|nr:hypothetical protein [Deinococcus apachensis]